MEQSTILSQNEIDALTESPVSRIAKAAKVSTSTVYTALRGKFVNAETAGKLRALASKTNGTAPKVSHKKKGRPGEVVLTTDERRQLRQAIRDETQYKFAGRTGTSQAAIRRALLGKGVREVTATTLRSALSGTETPPPRVAPRVIRHNKKAPKPSRDLASFLEGQIIMAEFLSMSIKDFMNGTETAK